MIEEPVRPATHGCEVGYHARNGFPADRPRWRVVEEMHARHQGVRFEKQQRRASRSRIDHGAIVVDAARRVRVERGKGGNAPDQGVLADIGEFRHGVPSRGIPKWRARNWTTTVALLKQKCTDTGAHREPVFS